MESNLISWGGGGDGDTKSSPRPRTPDSRRCRAAISPSEGIQNAEAANSLSPATRAFPCLWSRRDLNGKGPVAGAAVPDDRAAARATTSGGGAQDLSACQSQSRLALRSLFLEPVARLMQYTDSTFTNSLSLTTRGDWGAPGFCLRECDRRLHFWPYKTDRLSKSLKGFPRLGIVTSYDTMHAAFTKPSE